MAGLFIHTSNSMERLQEELCGVIAGDPLPALSPETIIVQSRGMERWISMQLAKKLGVWFNALFPFPNAFVSDLFQRALGSDAGPSSDFDPDVLCLRIMKTLPPLLNRKEFSDLADYLGGAAGCGLYRLCANIADVFDQYTLYRPSLLLSWEEKPDSSWQANLWNILVKEAGGRHRARLQRELLGRMAEGTFAKDCVGRRIAVFGIASLPRFHTDLLAGLSAYTDVHFFLLNPCREYWQDIVSDRELSRIMKKEKPEPGDARDLHFETGNSLLASLGAQGRDFHSLLSDHPCGETWAPAEPGEASMLQIVKSDIFHLKERGKDEDAPRRTIAEGDASVQFHSCHSAMREVEVLHDNLLSLFEKIPGLLPSDIVVMAPDIETYAPYVHAVFGTLAGRPTAIPYSLSDRSALSDSAVAEAFFSLLSLCQGRFGAGEVLSLLERPCVGRAFGIGEEELATVKRWAADTNIRWGLDEQDRERQQVPAFSENTWRSGLDMMLAGFAMHERGFGMFSGIAPYGGVEAESPTLSRLLEFMSRLSLLAAACRQNHPLEEWSVLLLDAAGAFLSAQEEELPAQNNLRTALADLARNGRRAGYGAPLELDAVVAMTGVCLSSRKSSAGFLCGQVTFCSMIPMRSIPFRVICMLGMNDNAFPRKSRRMSWDMMAKKPQKQDRSLEKEDRYLFLESILSCRDVLYISYIGLSLRDNSEANPSVVVCELMEYLGTAFHPVTRSGDADSILDSIVSKHRLQAFSTRYFEPGRRLFSYSAEQCAAAAASRLPKSGRRPFFGRPIGPAGDEFRSLAIDDLVRFFSHPVKFLFEKRLGVRLDESAPVAADTEPISLSGLEQYSISRELLGAVVTGLRPEECFDYFKSKGALPHGSVGVSQYALLSAEILGFAARLKRAGLPELGPPQPFELSINGFGISGIIEGGSSSGIVQYRYADTRPKDLIRLWIHHCAFCAIADMKKPVSSLLVTRDDTFRFTKPQDPTSVLSGLLELYLSGLCSPLHFFPRTSLSFGGAVLEKGENREAALTRCRRVWDSGGFGINESDDPYYRLCFADTYPLDESFRTTSLAVFSPLFECMEGRGV
jgi:exodeoxyribonuclease V gamma subunit